MGLYIRSKLFQTVLGITPGPKRPSAPRHLRRSRLQLESLEDRFAPAGLVGLGQAANYAIVALNGFSMNGPGTINGSVASGTHTVITHPAVINGTVFYSGSTPSGNGTVTGGEQSANLSQVFADAESASSAAFALPATQTFGAITDTTTINGNGGTNVVDVSEINLSHGALTLNGSASDTFIVNVAGNIKSSNSNIAISGGVTADHVLINVSGSVTITGGGPNNFYGTILDPNGQVTVHDKLLTGELIGNTITDTSGFSVNHQPPTCSCTSTCSMSCTTTCTQTCTQSNSCSMSNSCSQTCSMSNTCSQTCTQTCSMTNTCSQTCSQTCSMSNTCSQTCTQSNSCSMTNTCTQTCTQTCSMTNTCTGSNHHTMCSTGSGHQSCSNGFWHKKNGSGQKCNNGSHHTPVCKNGSKSGSGHQKNGSKSGSGHQKNGSGQKCNNGSGSKSVCHKNGSGSKSVDHCGSDCGSDRTWGQAQCDAFFARG